MECTKALRTKGEIWVHHTLSIVSRSWVSVVGFSLYTFVLRMCHKFSIGLKSRLCPGQGPRTSIPLFSSRDFTRRDVWYEAPSCMNIVQLRVRIIGFKCSSKTDKYCAPLIVVFCGRKYKFPRPDVKKLLRIIEYGAFLTVLVQNFSDYRLPVGRPTYIRVAAISRILHSSLHNTFFHISAV